MYMYTYVNAECPTRGRTWELCLFSPRAQEFPAAHAYDQTDMVKDGKRFHTHIYIYIYLAPPFGLKLKPSPKRILLDPRAEN